MDANSLDAVMYPTGSPFGSVGSNLRLSPNTGLPALTVPMGVAAGTEKFAGIGGANIELVGRAYAEPKLISIGYAYEQATRHRTTPSLYPALAGDVFPGPGDDDDPAGSGAVTVARSVANASKGQQFTVTVTQDAAALFAFDLTVGYDSKAFSLVSAVAGPSGTSYTETSTNAVTVVDTKLGTSPASQGPTTLVTLTFKATKAGSTAGIIVTGLDTADPNGTVVSMPHVRDAGQDRARSRSATARPPASRRARTVTGPITVKAGASLELGGATVTGPITVEAGGSLQLQGATVTGPIKADGAAWIRICGSTITGPVTATATHRPRHDRRRRKRLRRKHDHGQRHAGRQQGRRRVQRQPRRGLGEDHRHDRVAPAAGHRFRPRHAATPWSEPSGSARRSSEDVFIRASSEAGLSIATSFRGGHRMDLHA